MYILCYVDDLDGYAYTISVSKSVELLKDRAAKYLKDHTKKTKIVWETFKLDDYTGRINKTGDIFIIKPVEFLEKVEL